MMDDHFKFLERTADRLRELAQRSPDIARELRGFADDLERLAASRQDDPSLEQPE